MSKYQPTFIAAVTINMPHGSQTIIGVSHFEQGATAHLADVIEAHGYTQAQTGRILDRARVTRMDSKQLGATLTLPGELRIPFGQKA